MDGLTAPATRGEENLKTQRKSKPTELLTVEIIEAKPNKLFSEAQRSMVRFLRYNQTLPCAECGKRRRVMWTMLCSFNAHSLGMLALKSGKQHAPLTPVCGAHPIGPAWPEEGEQPE